VRSAILCQLLPGPSSTTSDIDTLNQIAAAVVVASQKEQRQRAYIWRCKMPIVHANVWEGFGQKKAKTVIQGITKVFVDMGIPKHAVEVLVHEIPKSHWGVAGEPASEVLKDEAPPL
jgi:4-oxalocrotonate tautomerase